MGSRTLLPDPSSSMAQQGHWRGFGGLSTSVAELPELLGTVDRGAGEVGSEVFWNLPSLSAVLKTLPRTAVKYGHRTTMAFGVEAVLALSPEQTLYVVA